MSLINELSSAMDTLSRLGKDRALLRTTEVTFSKIQFSIISFKQGKWPAILHFSGTEGNFIQPEGPAR